jgi:hypothetical protein
VEVTAFLPAMTLAGLNEHFTPAGRFEQESVTAACVDPETGTTLTFDATMSPQCIVNAEGVAPR